MRGIIAGLVTAAALVGLSAAVGAGELVLYTASNPKIEKDIIEGFRKDHPDIEVQSINLSTGPITEKAIAEMGNPQADVIWMVNNFALERLKQAGALEPYTPKEMVIAESFKDPDNFYYGHNATIMAMAVNKRLLAERKLPMPTDWVDLIKPEYKGQVSVAAATKSGTGFTIFANMLDMYGWNFIDNIHQNIFQYTDGGSVAARQAGSGEIAIGLSYDTAILQQVEASPDVELVIGRMSPNIIEGAGLIAGAPHQEEAKLFLDWLFSEAGMQVFAPHVGIGAAPGHGNIELSSVYLWVLRRPIDEEAFKQEWAKRYE